MELLKSILTSEERVFNLWENSIVLAYRGSISQGTYVPKDDPNHIDDKDIMGIAIPPIDRYFGLKEFEQFEKIEQYWDIVIYDFKKALRLLVKSNPNIMQLLWTPNKHILFSTSVFEGLRLNRNLFVNKSIYHSYCGYAYSQLKKMENGAFQGYMGEKRKSLVEKFGYDAKNASHLIRLLRQGIEFLNTGELLVERPDAKELIEIKLGGWTLEQVKETAAKLFATLESSFEKSKLPEHPDVDKINTLMVALLSDYFKMKKEG